MKSQRWMLFVLPYNQHQPTNQPTKPNHNHTTPHHTTPHHTTPHHTTPHHHHTKPNQTKPNNQTDRQTDKQTDRQTDKQTNKQTNTHKLPRGSEVSSDLVEQIMKDCHKSFKSMTSEAGTQHGNGTLNSGGMPISTCAKTCQTHVVCIPPSMVLGMATKVCTNTSTFRGNGEA